MYTLLVILIVIAAILMIGVVLIQESKGGGLSSNFSSSNAIMGVRKTTDFVEKLTWGLRYLYGCAQCNINSYCTTSNNRPKCNRKKQQKTTEQQTQITYLILAQVNKNKQFLQHKDSQQKLLQLLQNNE